MSEVSTKVGTLRCTLGAAKKVNSHFGNFINARNRIIDLNLDAFVFVVAVGLDKEPKDVEAAVYEAGSLDLSHDVGNYLDLLANGGRPYVAPKDEKVDSGNA